MPATAFLVLVVSIVGLVLKPDYNAAFTEEIDAQIDLENVSKSKRRRKDPPKAETPNIRKKRKKGGLPAARVNKELRKQIDQMCRHFNNNKR